MIKDENFLVIQGWMVNKLELKGLELLVYAIIYGFSQTEGCSFKGSLAYLAEWTNATKRGVMKALKGLISKDLIEKKETFINKIKYCEYRAKNTNEVVNKVQGGSEQSSSKVVNKVQGGSEQSSYNNIDNNIEDNININNTDIELKFNEFYNKYPRKESKLKALESFKRCIEKNKIKFDDIINGLDKYLEHIKNQRIERKFIKQPATWLNQGCWQDEYVTQEQKVVKKYNPYYNVYAEDEYYGK